MSETEVDQQLSKAIVIFRYIEDKDVFQKVYCDDIHMLFMLVHIPFFAFLSVTVVNQRSLYGYKNLHNSVNWKRIVM